ncbi:PIF1-like helicase [Medicago truncatula]|uniref:PIF1-like helicase n=1 Tax=Medicago truncatula TaxID=3880 RepID=A0A072VGV8_MEDTR|nr:PIF1-like helicase [Medicago truncatula]
MFSEKEFAHELNSSLFHDVRVNLAIQGHLKAQNQVGVPIMLLRNIDQAKGLCNDTRLQVNQFENNYTIIATAITGKSIGERLLIPRIDLVPSNSSYPFRFSRRQFPISLCFGMTLNKCQG